MAAFSHAKVAVCLVMMGTGVACEAGPRAIVNDSLGGTLARDHQSRAMYFQGKYRRTYLAYMDHDFNARITYYDHDDRSWAKTVLVDDCIAQVRWGKGIKDGHNVPNLWVSKSGVIHLVYGSHGSPFKYARSAEPECIDQWELGVRIGDYATYPFFCELPDGAMLMFYRYGPTGGYKDPFLAFQRTDDEGRTWSQVKKIGAFRNACKLNGYNALYDEKTGRIHLQLALRPEADWASFACQYDPAADRMYSWDGKTYLGPMPGDDALVEHCRVEGRTLREIFVHDGILYMLLRGKGGALSFARWDGEALRKTDLPAEKTAGYIHGPIWTTDGRSLQLYGVRKDTTQKPTPHGADVYVWTSADGGETWDNGKALVRQSDLGLHLQDLNRVMGYPGDGPFLIISEATGQLPKDFEVTPENHYDNPWRRDKRLYAIDEEGHFLSGPEE